MRKSRRRREENETEHVSAAALLSLSSASVDKHELKRRLKLYYIAFTRQGCGGRRNETKEEGDGDGPVMAAIWMIFAARKTPGPSSGCCSSPLNRVEAAGRPSDAIVNKKGRKRARRGARETTRKTSEGFFLFLVSLLVWDVTVAAVKEP